MRIITFSLLLLCSSLAISSAAASTPDKVNYPYSIGLIGGYGWTTWGALIPPGNKQNLAMSMATPIDVHENGELWGIFAGYEFSPFFALQATYLHFPDAKVSFDSNSIFSFEHDGLTSFVTQTEAVSLTAKIMLIIPQTQIRLYSSLGAASLHRNDKIKDNWIASPTFGAGFNYDISDRIVSELGAVYTAGRGQSELNPIEDYFPFVYTLFLQVGYRFNV